MIERSETVLVAVSGGQDSVTLLHLLLELRKPWKLKLGILHINHGLRGKASDLDEAFVRALAKKTKLPIDVLQAKMKQKERSAKLSLEEGAREIRYQFFEKMAKVKRAQKIAVAHTQDDQAETVLMRVITGTGLQGLQAIRPKRKLNGAYLIRPLIEIPRSEIQKYVKINRIHFREDKSNRSPRFLRNRIRHRLIPFIARGFNPQIKKALARLPHLLDVDLTFLDETAKAFYKRLAREHPNEILFPRKTFLKLSPAIQYRLMNRALHILNEAELDFDHWNRFSESLHIKRGFQLQLPKGLLASVSSDSIRIKKGKRINVSFSYPLFLGDAIYIPEIEVSISCSALKGKPRIIHKSDKSFELLNGAKLSFPLTIRNRKAGDRFQPLGRTKPLKLKRFLINQHIPVEERDRLPLVLSDSTIAIAGQVALAEPFKVTPETKQFVRISFTSGN
ncbi:MAG: tRNA lysidine(34) synthetase TilS [Candidatus Omnitrophica bacterium]|nr:tRNA lysidine(34) synthetase TilS [Candidatus Omnitrophota bacterium]